MTTKVADVRPDWQTIGALPFPLRVGSLLCSPAGNQHNSESAAAADAGTSLGSSCSMH